jgi:hypothetical protein
MDSNEQLIEGRPLGWDGGLVPAQTGNGLPGKARAMERSEWVTWDKKTSTHQLA